MIRLEKTSTLPPTGSSKSSIKKQLKANREELFKLQNKLYADGRYSLLIILQGLDTSGKDGTIRKAFKGMNPQGVDVKSFKKPGDLEQKHDFLWRIYPEFPAKGMIKIFNRSYYEDVLVPSVENHLSDEVLQHHMDLINTIEQHLTRNDTVILKFFLHISPEEQQERILKRKQNPHKRWKYDPEDEKVPLQWNDYQKAYQKVINYCNQIPWHVVPSDKKWFRNNMVAELVRKRMEGLDLKFPKSRD